jgi:hypothetical protein
MAKAKDNSIIKNNIKKKLLNRVAFFLALKKYFEIIGCCAGKAKSSRINYFWFDHF